MNGIDVSTLEVTAEKGDWKDKIIHMVWLVIELKEKSIDHMIYATSSGDKRVKAMAYRLLEGFELSKITEVMFDGNAALRPIFRRYLEKMANFRGNRGSEASKILDDKFKVKEVKDGK